MKKRLSVSISGLLIALSASAQEVDTSSWECRSCTWPESATGSWIIGAGWVSDDEYRFGDYTGLEDGAYAVLSGSASSSSEASYWRFNAANLGLDSRELMLEGGKPGQWQIRSSWSETPHRINDTGLTPFGGVGTGQLSLPAAWVTAPFTSQMTTLLATSRPFDLESARERFTLGIELTPPGHFNYQVSYSRDLKEGMRVMGGGFMFTSALLPAPVDYVTDQVDARAGFVFGKWVGEFSYYGSFFDNEEDRLQFDNPFNPLVPGASKGRFSLEPDNEFHRFGLSAHYRLTPADRLSGRIGFGRMSQDQAFLPYTINPTPIAPIALGPLPRGNLDGKVDVVDFNVKYSSRFESGLRLAVEYDFYERDNKSPQDDYTYVTQDLYVNPARRNIPFSYQRQQLQLRGNIRKGTARLSGGLQYQDYERTLEQRSDTDESSGWLRLNVALAETADAQLEVRRGNRNGADLSIESAIAIGENPLLRKFSYADRDRTQIQARISALPLDAVQVSGHVNWRQDDYDDSLIGLTDSNSLDYTLDIALMPEGPWAAHVFYTGEDIESSLANSDVGGSPNWFAETNDDIRTAGAGISFSGIGERGVKLSLDYVYSDGDSSYGVRSDDNAPFPDLETRLSGARIRLDWPLKNGSSLTFDYYHENFETRDWTVDGIDQDTVFNLLALGEDAFDYSVDTLTVWYRAAF